MRLLFLSVFTILFVLFDGTVLAAQEAVTAFDADAATNAYLATFTGAEREASDAYFEGGYWLILWNMLYGLMVAAIILSKGRSAHLRDWCENKFKNKFGQTFIYAGAFILLSFILSLPLTIYQEFYREHQYSLATQAFGPWFIDALMALGISTIMGGLAIALLYLGIRKTGEKWWLWGAGGTVVLLLFLMLIAPVFIQPLFNNYTPLEDPAIEKPILEMARKAGVRVNRIFMVDASQQSNRISANVSGFMATKRIALNDNLLNRSTLPEIKAVMGHEMGHYVLGHTYTRIFKLAIIFAVGFYLINKSYPHVRDKWGQNWQLRDISDIAGLPLFMAIFSIYMFILTPVMNSIIYSAESEADAYGLETAREPDGFATIALKLGQYRKLEPSYWEEIFFFDHPSGRTRIQMSMDWKAAHLDEVNGNKEMPK